MARTALSRTALAVAVAAVLLAACGGGSSSKSSSSSTSGGSTTTKGSTSSGKALSDAALCKIITADDAAKVFGEPAQQKPPAGVAPGASAQCLYDNPNDGLSVRNLLQVRVYPRPQYYGEKIYPGAQSLSGLGDKAFVSTQGAMHAVEIQFMQNGRTVSINYSAGPTVNTASKVAELEAIAHKVSDNM